MNLPNPSLRATILGLGAGTLLCQFQKPAQVNLVEIDEQVIKMANNPDLFTNLRDCPAQHHVFQADGRIAMAQFPDLSTDLLIMDAFSSDAIPVHLLTLEAFSLYQKKMTSGGVILINISNRHIHVLPVITAIAHKLDLIVLSKADAGNPRLGQFPSQWALLTSNETLAMQFMQREHWHFVTGQTAMLWTDDYSNIISCLT